MTINDVVELIVDFPEQGLAIGAVGTIVAEHRTNFGDDHLTVSFPSEVSIVPRQLFLKESVLKISKGPEAKHQKAVEAKIEADEVKEEKTHAAEVKKAEAEAVKEEKAHDAEVKKAEIQEEKEQEAEAKESAKKTDAKKK